jgi:hypothetical protein
MKLIADNISFTIAIFLMMAGLPGFWLIYSKTQNPTLSVTIFFIYETFMGIIGFLAKIWQKLEGKLADRLADYIDLSLQQIFSGYQHRYLEHINYQHRFFDVKGLRTQGPYNLELEKVFVQLSVDPTPYYQTTQNPIKNIPKDLSSGSHTIWEYISTHRIKNLAVVGAPGSGKTTMLKHMALTLTAPPRHIRKKRIPMLIPVLLFLRDHRSDITDNINVNLTTLIRNQFERRQVPIPPDGWLEKQLEKGNCLIMLDGLDEIADIKMRRQVVIWVEKCMEAYGNNRFIITSRPHGYKSNPLSNVTVLQVRPFTDIQVKQFIHNWYLANELMSSQKYDQGIYDDARLGADDLLKRLQHTPTLSSLAINPLLLTMIATVHRYRSSLPGRRVELYAEICEVFLGKRHEARGIVTELTPAQKQRVLQPIAYYLMKNKLQTIKLADIEGMIKKHLESVSPFASVSEFLKEIENTSGLLLERESGEYGFSHLTFQEYLAAVHALENGLEKELYAYVTDPWWQETIRLYCAQTDGSNVIQACVNKLDISALALAIDCMNEAREVNSMIRKIFSSVMERGLEHPNPEVRRIVAEARLRARLREYNESH